MEDNNACREVVFLCKVYDFVCGFNVKAVSNRSTRTISCRERTPADIGIIHFFSELHKPAGTCKVRVKRFGLCQFGVPEFLVTLRLFACGIFKVFFDGLDIGSSRGGFGQTVHEVAVNFKNVFRESDGRIGVLTSMMNVEIIAVVAVGHGNDNDSGKFSAVGVKGL